jgi:integrase
MARNPHGSIAINAQVGRLRLQFPRRWFDGQQKYLSLGIPDTEDNRLHAQNLAREIGWAYLKGEFDPSLEAYKPKIYQPEIKAEISISRLWTEYCKYKSRSLKAASLHYLVNTIGRHIYACPYKEIVEALEIRGWLLGATTPNMARRITHSLATAVSWGAKHQLIPQHNPFLHMAGDIRVDNTDPSPNAFNSAEKDHCLKAFYAHKDYSFYAPLVKFWFLCGCRPSEGIGLQWEQIAPDYSKIRFDRSITHLDGKVIYNKQSKTNRSRGFPCNDELKQFLIEHRTNQLHPSLVFPSKHQAAINYDNFSKRAWDKVIDPILQRASTPYSCRDTFITDQIAKGIPIGVIAKWVDNSTEMIERYYLDVSSIDHIKPL